MEYQKLFEIYFAAVFSAKEKWLGVGRTYKWRREIVNGEAAMEMKSDKTNIINLNRKEICSAIESK